MLEIPCGHSSARAIANTGRRLGCSTLDMFVVRVLLTLQLVGWSASQAPGDADTFCTVDLVSQHPIYPNNIRVLMDSADYQNLLRENTIPDPVWQTVDVDGIGNQLLIRVNVS